MKMFFKHKKFLSLIKLKKIQNLGLILEIQTEGRDDWGVNISVPLVFRVRADDGHGGLKS